MPSDENALDIINRMFAEAARAQGDDPSAIANRVEALVEALEPAERVAVRAAFERMVAFSPTQWPVSDTRH